MTSQSSVKSALSKNIVVIMIYAGKRRKKKAYIQQKYFETKNDQDKQPENKAHHTRYRPQGTEAGFPGVRRRGQICDAESSAYPEYYAET